MSGATATAAAAAAAAASAVEAPVPAAPAARAGAAVSDAWKTGCSSACAVALSVQITRLVWAQGATRQARVRSSRRYHQQRLLLLLLLLGMEKWC